MPSEHIDVNSTSDRPLAPQPVTIPPVYIEGEATSARRLVEAHDAANARRSCLNEGVTAAFGALEVAGGAAGTALASTLGPLALGALAGLAGLSFSEGQKLRAFYNCETE
ncbi:MAG TPA: hypothetical protein VEQ58_18960 [Polyangiaceae bacterium]|nr:hypothetical protein [Polyangiaceae bacterium]